MTGWQPLPDPRSGRGAGSQQQEEDWAFLPLPHEVETFRAPLFPEQGEAGAAQVLPLLRAMVAALNQTPNPSENTLIFPVAGLDDTAQRLLAQVMGEGEVSAKLVLPHQHTLQIQESVYTGIWRVLMLDEAGTPYKDHIEIGSIPRAILEQSTLGKDQANIPAVQGHMLMNALAIANEIAAAHRSAVASNGKGSHVVNFSLLPVTPEDMTWLEGMLGQGRIGLFSRGYGKCVVMATALRHVWRVRYYDGLNKNLLDTVEVTRIPEVVLASAQDLADSLQHLRDIVQWLEPG